MKTEPTAIIVNDRGEVFIGWRSACSITVSGWEEYHSVPAFGTPTSHTFKENDFTQMGFKTGDMLSYNQPYVFSSVRAAEKAMNHIYGHGKLAVVT